ncbi:MAG: hypothetical protein ABSB59_41630 [Streptosporangiaceae bacterium]
MVAGAGAVCKDAALHGLPPARTGRPGRPRVKGDRLPSLAKLAAAVEFSQVTVVRYGRTETVAAAVVTCLWYSVFGSRPVTVVIVRDKPGSGFGIALVTTDREATAEQVIERYAARWSIACQAAAVTWYATAGHDSADLHERRALTPWYTSKAEPATADMAAKLRRVMIAARFRASRPDQPTPQEIAVIRLAWENAEPLAA